MPFRLSALLRLVASVLVLSLAGLPALAQQEWFETDALNPGLGAPPEMLDRETPMSTMEAFRYYTEREDFAQAAHLLDLTDLPQQEQATQGAERARKLSVIMERKVIIPWSQLSDRPDGWLEGSSKNESTGRIRRSIMIDQLETESHFLPLRMNRVKPGEDAAPVWVFSRQSVDNIPQLFSLFGPTDLEKDLPDWARKRAFWNLYVWEVIFIPMLVFGALFLSLLFYRTLRRIGQNAGMRWVRIAARALKWPATLTVFATILGTGTGRVLVVSGLLDAILSPLLLIIYVVAATLAIVMIIDQIFDMISTNDPDELADPDNAHRRALATTISAARKFVIVIAVIVGSGIVLTSINTFQTIGLSLLASAGALTIVLGFAAREVLGNILASVQIALNRSARIGDQLIFEGYYCTVERIHFTYVQLLVWNNTRLIVPVSYFVKDPFENWSVEGDRMVRDIKLKLAQTADVDAMRDVFFDLLGRESDDDIAPRDKAGVHVIGHDAFGIEVRFEVPTCNPATAWDIECKIREKLLAEARRMQGDKDAPTLPPVTAGVPDAP